MSWQSCLFPEACAPRRKGDRLQRRHLPGKRGLDGLDQRFAWASRRGIR